MIGDFEEADAFDTAPADPEQVARRYRQYEGGTWEGLTDEDRAHRVSIVALLLVWLRRQGGI